MSAGWAVAVVSEQSGVRSQEGRRRRRMIRDNDSNRGEQNNGARRPRISFAGGTGAPRAIVMVSKKKQKKQGLTTILLGARS